MATDSTPSPEWWSLSLNRIGSGDWFDPDVPVTRPQHIAWHIFWDCLCGVAPEAIYALYDDVYPALEGALGGETEALIHAIATWGADWNLEDEWAHTMAAKMLAYWMVALEHIEDPRVEGWNPIESYRRTSRQWEWIWALRDPETESETGESQRIPLPDAPEWDPTGTPWNLYEKLVLDDVKRYLRRYRDWVERDLEEAGLVETPTKRSRQDHPTDIHFRWLVRFQVLEESQEEIAARPLLSDESARSVEPRSVQDGIRKVAELIGLTRRSV